MSQREFDKDLFKAYEDGKHRRYSLMFAVNGGAFAVARLLGEKGNPVAGDLTLRHLAVGMILFTTIMSFDILTFGLRMRKQWKTSVPDLQKPSILEGLFALPGWIVLTSIWLLISAGWLFVSMGRLA